MKVSIALAIYNGAQYLEQQLFSILAQSQQPDELVICDDCSTDNSLNIAHSFANINPFKTIIKKNTCQLGYSKNFEQAIDLCTGDLIFISDQDDFWLPHKIQIMSNVMVDNPLCFIAINNTEIVNSTLIPSGITKIQQVRKLYGHSHGYIPGCCSVIRSSFKELYVPFPHDMLAYDSWLHFIGSAFNARKVIYDTLQYYRIHHNNTSRFAPNTIRRLRTFDRLKRVFHTFSSGKNNARRDYLRLELQLYKLLLSRLQGLHNKDNHLCSSNIISSDNIAYISAKIKTISLRISFIEHRNPIILFRLFRLMLSNFSSDLISFHDLLSDLISK
ncbi:glycosyltransferase [bacterium]|nr:glycosyltransferase [bacterium]